MKFRDLNAQYKALKPQIDLGIQNVIEDSSFILGKPVEILEKQLAESVNRKYCVSVGSGTDALQLALMLWGIGPGDAVFTSDFTYFASAGSASILGATPVFVDIDLKTFNLDPQHLEKQIKKTIEEGNLIPKVIIPVDLFGLPADFERIENIAKKYDLKILEDAAQGFGGRIGNRKACSFGNLSATSFFPAKPLGCYGDGGAVFTDDQNEYERLKSLRAQGKSPTDKYDNREIGINSRLDTIQAAILLPKLKAFFDYELDSVNRVANRYSEKLTGWVNVPNIPDTYLSSWAQYSILFNSSEERNEIKQLLAENGIPTMIYYPRGLHQQGAYKSMSLPDSSFPNTIQATETILSLPIHPYLKNEDIDKVCTLIIEGLKKFRCKD